MHHLRLKALEDIGGRKPVTNPKWENKKVSDVYGESVFGDRELKAKLHASSYKAFKKSLEEGALLDAHVADEIASAMKEWAVSKGATHFTHWFQPHTGLTAEKHDSFISFKGGAYDRTLEVHFSGKQLIKGESDASSFPNGGIRSTFEARGYTAWDMESPSFIREAANGNFLCIPTAFASWTGEALDLKTPLLKSIHAVSKATARLCNVLGNSKVTGGYSNNGIEQEFFLIDRGFFNARPDLVAAGRTVIGASPPKGQQMEDHYFGALDRRILAFFQDTEWKLWSLGIPSTTRHNEVAPSQYEMAPVFEAISVACDHNMVMMEILKDTAREHGFACLLHEKPFAGVNGSGKHNNFSICTNTGENLFEPGDNPRKNAQFLVVLAATIRAVHVYADLMRSSIAVPGNDWRLGANEAPPAIISTYIGDLLGRVVEEIVKEPTNKLERQASTMQLGVNSLPKIPRDQSDRNRTSPYAFTGNKFEFRAVGSSQSCARPATVLNTMMADSFHYVSDLIEAEHNKNKPMMTIDEAATVVVTRLLKEHQAAIYNGNGYSEEWVIEAKSRGLNNLRTTPEAIAALSKPENLSVFERMKVLTRREVESQQNIYYEHFSKTVGIEAECMIQMTSAHVVPACLKYKQQALGALDSSDAAQKSLLDDFNTNLSNLLTGIDSLKKHTSHAKHMHENEAAQAVYFRKEVMDSMVEVRKCSDNLELLVDDALWPFPKYSEMLSLR